MEQKYKVLAVTTLSALMAALDSTIIYLALPEIGKTFNAGISYLTLIVVSYIISSTVMLIPSIGIIRRFGNKNFYILGFIFFVTSSFIISISFNITIVVLFRFVEGIGAGMMTSSDIPIILNAFPENERGKAIGINSIAWSIGTLIGPVIGGFLVLYNWRYIFLLNVPVGTIAIILAAKIIKNDNGIKSKVNIMPSLSTAIFIIPLIIGISFINIKYLIIAMIIFPLFFYFQYKKPLIDKKLLKNKQFLFITIASFLESFAFFSVLYALSLYFESDLRISSFNAGILLFTYPLGSIISSPLGGILYDKFKKPEIIMISGTLMEAIPIMLIAIYLRNIPELLFISGFGGSLFWAPSTTMIVDALGNRYRSQANNSMFILRNIGLVLSISLLPLFIVYYSKIKISIGTIFVNNVSINIASSVTDYLLFSAFVSISSIIFILLNFMEKRGYKKYN